MGDLGSPKDRDMIGKTFSKVFSILASYPKVFSLLAFALACIYQNSQPVVVLFTSFQHHGIDWQNAIDLNDYYKEQSNALLPPEPPPDDTEAEKNRNNADWLRDIRTLCANTPDKHRKLCSDMIDRAKKMQPKPRDKAHARMTFHIDEVKTTINLWNFIPFCEKYDFKDEKTQQVTFSYIDGCIAYHLRIFMRYLDTLSAFADSCSELYTLLRISSKYVGPVWWAADCVIGWIPGFIFKIVQIWFPDANHATFFCVALLLLFLYFFWLFMKWALQRIKWGGFAAFALACFGSLLPYLYEQYNQTTRRVLIKDTP